MSRYLEYKKIFTSYGEKAKMRVFSEKLKTDLIFVRLFSRLVTVSMATVRPERAYNVCIGRLAKWLGGRDHSHT